MKNSSFILLIFIFFALASCSDSNPVLTIEGGRVIGVSACTMSDTPEFKGPSPRK